MRLVSHFPRTDAGLPKLEINPNKPMELARWRVVTIADKYKDGIVGYDKFYQLDKWLCFAVWTTYDGLSKSTIDDWDTFQDWWLKKATPPDYITRARRWLRDKRLAEFPQHVVDAADRSQKSIANEFSGKGWDA